MMKISQKNSLVINRKVGRKTFEHIFVCLLLICVIVSVFVFQNQKNGFAAGHHGFLSSHGITLAKSIFADEGLLMFTRRSVLDNGQIVYAPYNRFPIFPFLIVGTVVELFEPNLSLQIFMARQVMNFFLILSILVSFKIINELMGNRFSSLVVIFLVFSSYYILFYNDMIFNDMPALFGYLLALLAIVKNQKQPMKRRYIVLIAIISISMGWQPYVVFLSWFLVDFIQLLFLHRLDFGKFKSMIDSPSFIALVSGCIWGITILGMQIINEWVTVGGQFVNIPTARSAIMRLGFGSNQDYAIYSDVLDTHNFLWHQGQRIVTMLVPFAGFLPVDLEKINFKIMFFLISIAWLIISINSTHRINATITTLITFTISGLLWAFLMKNFVAFHDFQSIFYIGFTIIFFSMLVSYIRSRRIVIILAAITCVMFIFSVKSMNVQKAATATILNSVTSEFQAIYDQLPKGSTVFVDGSRRHPELGAYTMDFVLINTYASSLEKAEYVLSVNPQYNQERITNNEHINLFRNVNSP